MENAGAGAARIIAELPRDRFPEPFTILCGPGNNGGDGFVIARHLHNRGLDVRIWVAPGTEFRSGSDAAVNFLIVRKMQLRLVEPGPAGSPWLPEGLLSEGTLVDALFGTGLSRSLEGGFLAVVREMNSSGRPIVAVDIPSGLDADTGKILGSAVKAERTITFAAEKTGFHLREGPAHCGQVDVVDIGIPRELWAG